MSEEPKTYTLTITIASPQGQQQLNIQVPEDHMQCCPCGSDLFDVKYRCVHIKPAEFHPQFFGVPQQCCAKAVYTCARCGFELSPLTPTKAAVSCAS